MAKKKSSLDLFRDARESLKDPARRKPVYVFYGEEQFFTDLLQEHVLRLIPDEQKDFNLDLLYGSDATSEQILSAARSYPMMADMRVVLLRDFQKLGKGNPEEEGLNDLIPYLESPNPQTLLVLIDKKGPDKRTKVGRALTAGKSATLYTAEFEKLTPQLIPNWVDEWVAHRYKKRIEPKAAQLLLQLAGTNLQLLSTELDKVCTFVDTSDRLTEADVRAVIGSYREYSTIELKEAVLARDLTQSLRIVEQMLLLRTTDTGEVIRTVGFFYSVFGNIWPILRLKEKGLNKSRIQEELGISSSWYFNMLWSDSSKFHLSDMPRVFEALLDADRASKGFTTLDTSSILLLMVKRLIG